MTTSFNRAQNKHVSIVIRTMPRLMWTLFIAEHVSFTIKLNGFLPSVNANAVVDII